MKKARLDGWDVGLVTVDAIDAQATLDAMTESQRTSSEAAIRNLVAEITDGKFGISNDALVRTASGVWLNGKHRMQAIVRTGKAQTFILLTVPDSEETKTLRIMDCGVTRTVAHVAEMVAHVKNAAIVAAVAKAAIANERGLLTAQGCYANSNRTAQEKYLSRDQWIDYIRGHAKALEASATIAKTLNAEYGLFGTSGPALIHYMVSQKHSTIKADTFLGVLFSGKGEKSEAVEPLRKAMIKELRTTSARKVASAVKTASIAQCFRAWEYGVKARGFLTVGEAFPKV